MGSFSTFGNTTSRTGRCPLLICTCLVMLSDPIAFETTNLILKTLFSVYLVVGFSRSDVIPLSNSHLNVSAREETELKFTTAGKVPGFVTMKKKSAFGDSSNVSSFLHPIKLYPIKAKNRNAMAELRLP